MDLSPPPQLHCAQCGTRLLTGPFPQCPLCALALANAWQAKPERAPDLSDLKNRFPEYDFLGEIGHGGFGMVYRVRHRSLRRSAALKLLATSLTRSVSVVARFEREMTAVGRLDHPGIVRAFDAGERDGQWFLAMEYVDGADLGCLYRKVGPLPTPDACEIIRQAALAMDYAHRRGLVHRDVKPGNLMLARGDGTPTVKVLDFGLAVIAESEAGDLTQSAEFLGTVEYIAPELLRSHKEVDARSDIYGLGATLYRLLTGMSPHGSAAKGESFLQRVIRISGETPVPIAARRANLPEGLAALCDRLLSRDPAARPASAAELAGLLAPYSVGANLTELLQRIPARAPADPQAEDSGRSQLDWKQTRIWRRIRRRTALGLAAAVLAIVAIVGWRALGPSEQEFGYMDGPLMLFDRHWKVGEITETTHDVRFARFHPITGKLWFSDGATGLYEADATAARRLRDGNLYNAVFGQGAGVPLICTVHNPPIVDRWLLDNSNSRIDIPFAPGEHPWGLGVVPHGWRGGHDLAEGDVLLAAGGEPGATALWRLRGQEAPHALDSFGELPSGIFCFGMTPTAIYFARWGSKANPPEEDGIWRVDAKTSEQVAVNPPLAQLAPGRRGPMCLACDSASGDLFISLTPPVKGQVGTRAALFRLKRSDRSGRKFKAVRLAEGFSDTARFGIELSANSRRIAVADDGAGKIFVLERR